jgi:hypothetical protein
MENAETLRRQAAEYRNRAKAILRLDDPTRLAIIALADEFEAEAAACEEHGPV